CLEPANQQEAYEMTREAFDLSEKFQIPIMIRLVTRLAHSRAAVKTGEVLEEKPLAKCERYGGWMLLPGMARQNFAALVDRQGELLEYAENCPHNQLTINDKNEDVAVITTGIARNYYMENFDELGEVPSHLHIGAYPVPIDKVRKLAASAKKVVLLEEGYPYVERYLRGYLDNSIEVAGKVDRIVPPTGELNPDNIRPALGLEPRGGFELDKYELPARPPQFCKGCPHADTYTFIKEVAAELGNASITSDIGCYALGALPPFQVPETIVDMGASVSMAKGAADAGAPNIIAVIGDSTFLHSGVTPLMDAVAGDADMTLIIVDNETVAMTGGQETLFPSSKLSTLVEGIGVEPKHVYVLNAHKKYNEENKEILRAEMAHPGISVIISVRECVETVKRTARQKVKA
ncbi:MAG: indolepyruvate ferredoxin oxidoreductase, partial [Spirochaetales bacterium]|nr:indolepyruvate ferredoxin oxidoreductase [Spirochaetales bacterium]